MLSFVFIIRSEVIQPEKARAPQYRENGVLFSFESKDAVRVYLAASFNNWALNRDGRVTNREFLMQRSGSGVWFKKVTLKPGTYAYKFVADDGRGNYQWSAD
ncbi:MAG: glycogen-binding domain-containing protein, partial [bacterium]|nr:glycogen-binding domain-containing protein [bacterium]